METELLYRQEVPQGNSISVSHNGKTSRVHASNNNEKNKQIVPIENIGVLLYLLYLCYSTVLN